MSEFKSQIGHSPVSIHIGDMIQFNVDAYVVPQFSSASSFGGVGGAVARAGAARGMEQYQDYVDREGEQLFGKVVITEAGGVIRVFCSMPLVLPPEKKMNSKLCRRLFSTR